MTEKLSESAMNEKAAVKAKILFQRASIVFLLGAAVHAHAALIVHQASGPTEGDACRVATNEANSPADAVAAGPLTSMSGCDCHKASKSGMPDWWNCTVQANHGK